LAIKKQSYSAKKVKEGLLRRSMSFKTIEVGTNQKPYAVLSKVDDFATFKKVEVHAENSTF